MLTLTSHGTITTVNAAFLQEVKDANPRLWSEIRELRAMRIGDEDPREMSKRFVEGLGDLRDGLAVEFSLEETYGFIDGVPRANALPTTDASIAKVQHRELYLQLHELCEHAEEAQYRGTIGRDLAQYLESYREFDAALRAHEELEEIGRAHV